MKQFRKTKLGLVIGCLCLSVPGLALADQLAAKANVPAHALDNIPEGKLKQSLSRLPAHVQQKVLNKMNSLGIPAIDLLTLDADEDGELFYIEEGLVEYAEPAPAETTSSEALPPVDVFQLHSNPGSAHTIFLDFDGGLVSGRAWGGGASYDAVPYDLDGDPFTFNDAERHRIHEIWSRIADDFSAFDVNVTTEAPASFGPDTGWLLFTKDTDGNGTAMPSQGAGGVAYVGVWGRSNYSYYQPAFVYYNRLGGGAATYMAEAGSHEMGHNFGLSHDGTSTQGYYTGLGADSEPSSWAPVMGVGYYKNITQWSRGDYPDANQFQDDIGIITNQLGSSQDVAGTQANPALLTVDGAGQFVATNREVDPTNQIAENKGTIQVGESDWFQFMTGTGPVSITATPAWDAFTRSTRRGANLDIGLRLFDEQGNLVAESVDGYESSSSIDTSLAEGVYVVEVFGAAGPYADNYGSQGHYYLNGQVTVGVADTTPPDPNPMSFASAPVALTANDIEMEAVVAVDDRGGAVSYKFTCTQGGAGCADSAWQSSTQFAIGGLEAETQYCFTVTARDLSGNETVASASECATTPTAPPEATPPQAPTGLTLSDNQDGTALVVWTDMSDNESAFELEREKLHKNGRWHAGVIISVGENMQSYADASGEGTFRYRVRAVNVTGASGWTAWSQVDVTSGSSGGGGNDKPCRGKKCQ